MSQDDFSRERASMKDYDAPERWRRRRNIVVLVIAAFVIAIVVSMIQHDRFWF